MRRRLPARPTTSPPTTWATGSTTSATCSRSSRSCSKSTSPPPTRCSTAALAGARIRPPGKQRFSRQTLHASPRVGQVAAATSNRKIVFTTAGSAFAGEGSTSRPTASTSSALQAWGTNVGGALPEADPARRRPRTCSTFSVEPTRSESRAPTSSAAGCPAARTSASRRLHQRLRRQAPRNSPARSASPTIEIEGPFNAGVRADAPVRKLLTGRRPRAARGQGRRRPSKVLASFARRAYRRPVKAGRGRPAGGAVRAGDPAGRPVRGGGQAAAQGGAGVAALPLPRRGRPERPRRRPRPQRLRARRPAELLPLVQHAGRRAVRRWRTGATSASPACSRPRSSGCSRTPRPAPWRENFAGQWLQLRNAQDRSSRTRATSPPGTSRSARRHGPRGRAVLRVRRPRTTAACSTSSTPTTRSSTTGWPSTTASPDVPAPSSAR